MQHDYRLGYFERFAPLGPVKRAMPPLPIDGLYAMYVEPAAADKPAVQPSLEWRTDKPPVDGLYESRYLDEIEGYMRPFKNGQWFSSSQIDNDRYVLCNQNSVRWLDNTKASPPNQFGWRTDTPLLKGGYYVATREEPMACVYGVRKFEKGSFWMKGGEAFDKEEIVWLGNYDKRHCPFGAIDAAGVAKLVNEYQHC